MSKEYTESYCVTRLTKMGCKFSGMKSFTVPKGRIGINALGMVDYLANECKMVPQYV
jgi:hypothetical protein